MRSEAWRVRLYVPDSDDERDDAAASNIHHPFESISPPIKLRIPHKYTSSLDSDLSELSDLHTSPNSSAAPSPRNVAVPDLQIDAQSTPSPLSIHPFTEAVEDVGDYSLRRIRELRPRRPEQIHPYLHDQNKHRMTFRAHGIRPVNVHDEPALQDSNENEEDIRFSSSEDELPAQSYSAILDSSSPHNRQSRESRSRTFSNPLNERKEIQDHVKSPEWNLSPRPPKRRKLAQSLNSTDVSSPIRNLAWDSLSSSPDEFVFQQHDNGISDFPAAQSPGINQPNQRDKTRPVFIHPNQLPSNVVQVSKSHRSPEKKSHQKLEKRAPTLVIDSSSDSESNSNFSSEEPSLQREVEKAGLRLKGVLPRSFASLDYQRQKELIPPNNRTRQIVTHHDERPARGVARAKPRGMNRFNDTAAFINLYDSEEDGDSNMPPAQSELETIQITHESPAHSLQAPMDPGRGMENDEIDFMLSTRARGPRNSVNKKRQTTLNQVFKSSNNRRDYTKGSASSTSKSDSAVDKRRKSGRKGNSSRRKHVQLGVLDLMDAPGPNSTVPDFIRLARRQARKTKTLGRHSPSGKYFRLKTREDTAEVNNVLDRWRQGHLKPKNPIREVTLDERLIICPLPSPTKGMKENVNLRERSERQKVSHEQDVAERRLRATIVKPQVFRTAQLETTSAKLTHESRRSAFESALRVVDQEYRVRRIAGLDNLFMNTTNPRNYNGLQVASSKKAVIQRPTRSRRPRKQIAKQLPIETKRYRQPEESPLLHLPDSHRTMLPQELKLDHPSVQHQHVRGWRSKYSEFFDIRPFPLGTFFHKSTFIGSGDFSRAIDMMHRELDISSEEHSVRIGTHTYIWSSWGEPMASAFRQVFKVCHEILENYQISSGTQSPPVESDDIQFCTNCIKDLVLCNAKYLSFLDPTADRISFITCILELMKSLNDLTIELLQQCLADKEDSVPRFQELLQLLVYEMVLTAQVDAIKPKESRGNMTIATINKQAYYSLSAILSMGLSATREYMDQNWDPIVRDIGIQSDRVVEEAVLIIRLVLDNCSGTSAFYKIVSTAVEQKIRVATKVDDLECIWRDFFTLLPFDELDNEGIVRSGRRYTYARDDWSLPIAIFNKVTEAYVTLAAQKSSQANEYVRVNLRRCFHLIQSWGWRRSDQVIRAIFDFYAKNNKLSMLYGEDSTGSPRYLELLDQEPALNLEATDKSFHIFLKILALGLKTMQKFSSEKDIKGLIYRCTPNHGREYHKEQEIQKSDFVALQNHHDLLSTLFWRAPSDYRQRILSQIEALVEHDRSHQHVCRLSVRTFRNLIRLELIDNDSLLLPQFGSWMNRIVMHGLHQFDLAKREIELQYELMSNAIRKANGVSDSLVQTTIKSNQKEVLATLGTIAAAMETAMKTAKSQTQIVDFFRLTNFERIFSLWEQSAAEASSTMISAIKVYRLFLQLPNSAKIQESLITSGESQFSEIDFPEVYESIEFIQLASFQLLSNVLGSDKAPQPSLTEAVVELWGIITTILVQRKEMKDGESKWFEFINAHGEFSWSYIPDTSQKRKYTPLFLATVIEHDPAAFYAEREFFLAEWLASLVERKPLLKFQHVLTAALLNASPEDPVLTNPPFTRDSRGKYDIHFGDIHDRRISLISTVLSNMAMHYEVERELQTNNHKTQRDPYKACRKLMVSSIQEQFSTLPNIDQIKGSYVQFVHQVIQLLYQYGSETDGIDTFFTQSSDLIPIPLPERDPEYFVSKLKWYNTKLSGSGTQKRLFTYLHNICEKKMVIGQQETLTAFLEEAMLTGNEKSTTPTLRAVLIQGVFPCFLERVIRDRKAWIIASPLIRSIPRSIQHLSYCFEATDPQAVMNVLNMITTILYFFQKTASSLIADLSEPNQSMTLQIATILIQSVTSTLSALDYIWRFLGLGRSAVEAIAFFRSFTILVAEAITGDEGSSTDYSVAPIIPSPQFEGVRKYGMDQLNNSKWLYEGGRYFFQRSRDIPKEVFPFIRDLEEEMDDLVRAIEEFHEALDRMKGISSLLA